jgi:hypothetical protein
MSQRISYQGRIVGGTFVQAQPNRHFNPFAHTTIAEYMGKEGCNVNIYQLDSVTFHTLAVNYI